MKILYPLVAGSAALASIIGGSAYFMLGQEPNQQEDVYLLVNAIISRILDETTKIAAASNYEGTTKDYVCNWGDKKDSDCELIEIDFPNTNKSITKEELKTSKTVIKQYAELFKEQNTQKVIFKQYLLKTHKSNTPDFEKSPYLPKVSITHEKTADAKDTLEMFVVGQFSQDWKFTGKSNSVIAKLESADDTKVWNSPSYTCTWDTTRPIRPGKQCAVLNTTQNGDVQDIDYSKIVLPVEDSDNATFSNDSKNYYFIALKSPDLISSKDIQNKKIIYIKKASDAAEATKVATFSIESLFFGDLGKENKQIIALSNS